VLYDDYCRVITPENLLTEESEEVGGRGRGFRLCSVALVCWFLGVWGWRLNALVGFWCLVFGLVSGGAAAAALGGAVLVVLRATRFFGGGV
jgi:hypothetical protein